VAEDGPADVAVLELRDGDFTGEGAVGLVEDVLGGDFEALAEVLAGEEEVEGGWGDDDFGVGVELGVVEVLDDVGDAGDGAVPERRSELVERCDGRVAGRTNILKLPPTKN
jgi:hypothetical protein